MRRVVVVAGIALALAPACRHTPQPLGEALVVVQTDVDVPRRVDHVSIEILGAKTGATVDTREVVTPSRDDWPVSFSVVLPDGSAEEDVFVRLRAYPEGHSLSARDLERFASDPPRNITAYSTLDDACKNAPDLHLAEPLTMRRGDIPITTLLQTQGCKGPTLSGSAVAKLTVTDPGDYQIAITHAVPDAANGEPGSDTSISLREQCAFPTTQLACSGPIGGGNFLSKIDRITLMPGTYWVVTGGQDPAPADLTIVASQLDVVQPAADAGAPAPTADTVTLEPEPGVTIDRIVGLHVIPGQRGKVEVTLRGECFGTAADLAGKRSCLDTAGELAPISPIVPRGALTRDFPTPPPWSGDLPQPCTLTPTADEICVPGGAFVLGDTLALQDLDRRSQPERMRVVDPFVIDKLEMTVRRYRAALAQGFQPPDAGPIVNGDAALSQKTPTSMCTWSTTVLGREDFPLTCTTWLTAHALCNFFGGDLPTEDQWEYAATAASRPNETAYPWGDDLPTCARTVYGHTTLATSACPTAPLGPVAANDPALASGDVTSLGIVGLAGNVEELTGTAFVRYSDPEWTAAGLRGPLVEAEAPMHSARGADWTTGALFATASTRRSEPTIARFDNVGFRCARKGR